MKLFHVIKSAGLTTAFRGGYGRPGIEAKRFFHLEKEENQKFGMLRSNENITMLFKLDSDTMDNGLQTATPALAPPVPPTPLPPYPRHRGYSPISCIKCCMSLDSET